MTLRKRLGKVVGAGSSDRAPAPVSNRARGGTRGKMLRAKPPNVIGRGPLLDGAGFGVVIVCIVKDEADYLEEWIAFHVALGVDHFIVYDNGSTDGSAGLLERHINHGLVTRIDWPLGGGQLAAYNHALRMFGATAAWMAFYDVDEFLVPLLDPDIPTFLARYGDAADVRVPRVEFGYSGHRMPPSGLTIDAYTQVANVLDLDRSLPPRVKSIVQPRAVSAIDIHLAFPADEVPTGIPTETAEETVRGVAQLNHYYTRSFEEFEAKRFRGSATGRIARPAVPFDLETIAIDDSAQRYSERTQASLARLRGLEPKPYYYGSELGLEYFPRPNDLFRFAEFALANTAAGLPEPSRIAASRVKNVYTGVGVVGDLAATGYAPVREGLSGSVHTQALVEHMRGRIESTLTEPGLVAEGGALAFTDGGAVHLERSGAITEVRMALPRSEMRRCYSLGFILGTPTALRIEASIAPVDGAPGAAITFEVPGSACAGGVVEVEPAPTYGASLSLRIHGGAPAVDLYDLFVISTG